MKHFRNFLAVVGLAPLLSGCMHTVISGGAPSPDKRLSLCMAKHGASGKAYVDLSKKRVFISIWREPSDYLHNDSERLFVGKYVFKGADLCETVHWHDSQWVTVDFFDFGDRISSYHVKAGSPSNYISTLTFVLDTGKGKFVEKK